MNRLFRLLTAGVYFSSLVLGSMSFAGPEDPPKPNDEPPLTFLFHEKLPLSQAHLQNLHYNLNVSSHYANSESRVGFNFGGTKGSAPAPETGVYHPLLHTNHNSSGPEAYRSLVEQNMELSQRLQNGTGEVPPTPSRPASPFLDHSFVDTHYENAEFRKGINFARPPQNVPDWQPIMHTKEWTVLKPTMTSVRFNPNDAAIFRYNFSPHNNSANAPKLANFSDPPRAWSEIFQDFIRAGEAAKAAKAPTPTERPLTAIFQDFLKVDKAAKAARLARKVRKPYRVTINKKVEVDPAQFEEFKTGFGKYIKPVNKMSDQEIGNLVRALKKNPEGLKNFEKIYASELKARGGINSILSRTTDVGGELAGDVAGEAASGAIDVGEHVPGIIALIFVAISIGRTTYRAFHTDKPLELIEHDGFDLVSMGAASQYTEARMNIEARFSEDDPNWRGSYVWNQTHPSPEQEDPIHKRNRLLAEENARETYYKYQNTTK